MHSCKYTRRSNRDIIKHTGYKFSPYCATFTLEFTPVNAAFSPFDGFLQFYRVKGASDAMYEDEYICV